MIQRPLQTFVLIFLYANFELLEAQTVADDNPTVAKQWIFSNTGKVFDVFEGDLDDWRIGEEGRKPTSSEEEDMRCMRRVRKYFSQQIAGDQPIVTSSVLKISAASIGESTSLASSRDHEVTTILPAVDFTTTAPVIQSSTSGPNLEVKPISQSSSIPASETEKITDVAPGPTAYSILKNDGTGQESSQGQGENLLDENSNNSTTTSNFSTTPSNISSNNEASSLEPSIGTTSFDVATTAAGPDNHSKSSINGVSGYDDIQFSNFTSPLPDGASTIGLIESSSTVRQSIEEDQSTTLMPSLSTVANLFKSSDKLEQDVSSSPREGITEATSSTSSLIPMASTGPDSTIDYRILDDSTTVINSGNIGGTETTIAVLGSTDTHNNNDHTSVFSDQSGLNGTTTVGMIGAGETTVLNAEPAVETTSAHKFVDGEMSSSLPPLQGETTVFETKTSILADSNETSTDGSTTAALSHFSGEMNNSVPESNVTDATSTMKGPAHAASTVPVYEYEYWQDSSVTAGAGKQGKVRIAGLPFYIKTSTYEPASDANTFEGSSDVTKLPVVEVSHNTEGQNLKSMETTISQGEQTTAGTFVYQIVDIDVSTSLPAGEQATTASSQQVSLRNPVVVGQIDLDQINSQTSTAIAQADSADFTTAASHNIDELKNDTTTLASNENGTAILGQSENLVDTSKDVPAAAGPVAEAGVDGGENMLDGGDDVHVEHPVVHVSQQRLPTPVIDKSQHQSSKTADKPADADVNLVDLLTIGGTKSPYFDDIAPCLEKVQNFYNSLQNQDNKQQQQVSVAPKVAESAEEPAEEYEDGEEEDQLLNGEETGDLADRAVVQALDGVEHAVNLVRASDDVKRLKEVKAIADSLQRLLDTIATNENAKKLHKRAEPTDPPCKFTVPTTTPDANQPPEDPIAKMIKDIRFKVHTIRDQYTKKLKLRRKKKLMA